MARDFWQRVQKSESCWLWVGARNNFGYGVFGRRHNGKTRFKLAHRHSYELVHGEIKRGLLVLHSCDNPSCVNPAHLEIGTQSKNMSDCASRSRMRPDRALDASTERAMNDLLRSGLASQRCVSRLFGVSYKTTSRLFRGISNSPPPAAKP
jgi:hypothetical protein